MLTRLYIHNHRCLTDFTMEFGQRTLLTGAPGSGKSSVLDVLYRLFGVPGFEKDQVTLWGDGPLQVFELHIALEGYSYVYRLEITHGRYESDTRATTEELSCNGERLSSNIKPSRFYASSPKHDDERANVFIDWWKHKCWPILVGIDDFVDHCREDRREPGVDVSSLPAWYRYHERTNPDGVAALNRELSVALERVERLHMLQGDPVHDDNTDEEFMTLVARIRSPKTAGESLTCRYGELSYSEQILIQLYALAYLGLEPGRLLSIEIRAPVVTTALRRWLTVLLRRAEITQSQVIVEVNEPDVLREFPAGLVKRIPAEETR